MKTARVINMKNLSLIFCLFLFYASVASAGETDSTLTRTMDSAGFSEEQVLQVQSMIKTAQQQGFPVNAVSGKVYEGISKHVDPDRIVQALERVTSRYEYCHALALKLTNREQKAARLGNTITAGIAAGLTRQDAEKLINSLQSRSRQMNRDELYLLAEETMLTARDMSRQGVSSGTTAGVVSQAVQKNFAAGEMRTMRNTFSRQGVQGNRESLARNYGTAIGHGVQAGDLEGHDPEGRGSGGTQGSGDRSGSNAGNEGTGGGSSSNDNSSEGSDNSGNSGGSSGGSGNSGNSSSSGGSEGSGGSSSGGSEGSGGSENSGGSGGSGGSEGESSGGSGGSSNGGSSGGSGKGGN